MRNAMTFTSHFIFGILTIFSVLINALMPFTFMAIFIIYELDEDWHISDGAWIDIRQYGFGMAVGVIVLLIEKFIYFHAI